MGETINFERSNEFLESQYYEDGYHKNNEALIAVSRHGDKAGALLSETGKQQGKDKGQSRERVGSGVKGYHSPEHRTKQMVSATVGSMVERERELEALEGNETLNSERFQKYQTRMKREFDYNPLSQEFLAEWGEQKDGVSWYHDNYREQAFDEKSLSAKDLANRAASRLYLDIRMVGRLEDNSKINLEIASHSPTLEMFIAEALKEEIERNPVNVEGGNIIEKMGGGMKVAEEFQIRAKTDEQGRLSAECTFRGKTYPINLARLKEMSQAWRRQVIEKEKSAE